MAKLSSLSIYVINQVKLFRLVLGISSRYLSTLLEHSSGYVAKIEDQKFDSQYPPHEWPKIASILKCTVHDLLPDAPNEIPGKLVEKAILSLNEKDDVKKVLSAMSNYGFFDQGKTLEDVTKHLFITDKKQTDTIENSMKDFPDIEILKNKSQAEYFIHKNNLKDN